MRTGSVSGAEASRRDDAVASSQKRGGLHPWCEEKSRDVLHCHATSCDFGIQPASSALPGSWSYVSNDTPGTPLVSGWFTIVQRESTAISGEWHFQKIGDPQGIGPQVGDGNYVGGLDGANFRAVLQPRFVDNNRSLNGQCTGSHIQGTWIWVSFPGVTGRGTFEAQRH